MKPIEISWDSLQVIVRRLPKLIGYDGVRKITVLIRTLEPFNPDAVSCEILRTQPELIFQMHINSDARYCWQLVTPITIVV